jgi:hypothetical protein
MQNMVISLVYYTGYHQTRRAKFISITQDAGDCDDVLKAVQGTYLASTNGLWEGSVGFRYNQALYSFQFFNMFISDDAYFESMVYLQTVLDEYIGNRSTSYNLAMMVLILTTYQVTKIIGDSYQYVSLTGTPNVIFDRLEYYGGMAATNASCNIPAQRTFDVTAGILTISYGYPAFASSCAQSFDPNFFGYLGNNPVILVQLDTRSVVAAMGVNIGVAGAVFDLEEVAFSQIVLEQYATDIEVDGMYFVAQQYYSPRYPGMGPILCLLSANSPIFGAYTPLCMISVQNMYGIPILNHQGADTSRAEPIFCNCSTDIGSSTACDAFALMVGVIVYTNNTASLDGYKDKNTLISLVPLIQLAQRYAIQYGDSWNEGMFRLNEDAYTAQFYISNENFTSPWADGTLEFCGFDCTIISVLGSDYFNQAISTDYYQLYNGSCSNPINTTEWTKLAMTPPVNLTENYYSCVPTATSAIFQSVGISQGNVSFLLVFLTLLMMPVSFALLKFYDSVPVKEEYSNEERDLALKEFLNQLLRARDGTAARCVMDGSIARIAEELVCAVSAGPHQAAVLVDVCRTSPKTDEAADNASTIPAMRRSSRRFVKSQSFAARRRSSILPIQQEQNVELGGVNPMLSSTKRANQALSVEMTDMNP